MGPGQCNTLVIVIDDDDDVREAESLFLWDSKSDFGLVNLGLRTSTLTMGPKSDSDSDSVRGAGATAQEESMLH